VGNAVKRSLFCRLVFFTVLMSSPPHSAIQGVMLLCHTVAEVTQRIGMPQNTRSQQALKGFLGTGTGQPPSQYLAQAQLLQLPPMLSSDGVSNPAPQQQQSHQPLQTPVGLGTLSSSSSSSREDDLRGCSGWGSLSPAPAATYVAPPIKAMSVPTGASGGAPPVSALWGIGRS
jgi:hypothetical protein